MTQQEPDIKCPYCGDEGQIEVSKVRLENGNKFKCICHCDTCSKDFITIRNSNPLNKKYVGTN